MKLSISKLTRDAGTQLRAALDEAKIIEYAEILDELPAVKVVYDGARHILWDGFHTTAAHERKGLVEVRAEVTPGDLRGAILLSCGANAAHGLPRTNEDKRRAVMRLLDDPEWAQWSNVAIAKACGVHHSFVARVRPPLSPGESQPRKTLDGRTINTGAIGKAPRGERPILFPGEPAAEVLAEKPLPVRPDPPSPARTPLPPGVEVLDADEPDGAVLEVTGETLLWGEAEKLRERALGLAQHWPFAATRFSEHVAETAQLIRRHAK